MAKSNPPSVQSVLFLLSIFKESKLKIKSYLVLTISLYYVKSKKKLIFLDNFQLNTNNNLGIKNPYLFRATRVKTKIFVPAILSNNPEQHFTLKLWLPRKCRIFASKYLTLHIVLCFLFIKVVSQSYNIENVDWRLRGSFHKQWQY